MPQDRTNLVWQAIELLRETSGRSFGLDVAVQKNIPCQAGMGGGSSDAAATLVAVNRLFRLGQSEPRLRELASQIGSDVAFFVDSRVARCTGRGELVERFANTHAFNLVLAMPPTGLSTAEVYRHSELSSIKQDSHPLVAGLLTGNLRQIGAGLWNRLQSSAGKFCPWIEKLQREFASVDCFGHQMTGSGAGYFGVFASRGVAMRAVRKLAVRLPQASFFCVSTVGTAICEAILARNHVFQRVNGHWYIDRLLECDKPFGKCEFTVLDFEATGGKPPDDRITEVAMFRVSNGEVVEEYSTLVNPGRKIPPYVIKLIGITNKMVKDYPYIEDILPKILDFMRGSLLVVHNASGDLPFLDEACLSVYGGVIGTIVFDTQHLTQHFLPELGGLGLERIANHFEIEVTDRHRAAGDAFTTVHILEKFLETTGDRLPRDVYIQ